MDRGDTPNTLLPLLALLAIAFPFAISYQRPATPGGNNPQAVHTAKQESNQEAGEQGPETQPHTAARLVEEFLNASADGESWPDGDPRKCYSLDFMIAIAADPIDSRLPRMFDSSVDSIQRAFEADGYVLDRFDLAWSEPASTKTETNTGKGSGKGADAEIKTRTEEKILRYRRLPSLLLFRKPPDLNKKKPSKGKLFLVFLVGETPTSGIHKAAMASALRQLASFYKWDPDHKELPSKLDNLAKDDPTKPLKIRIMGPSFSGSAPSLEFSLRDWLAGLPKDVRARVRLQIVSGSATAIDPKEFCKLGAGGRHTFQAVVPSDKVVMPRIYRYLESLGHGSGYKRIAMLRESGTAYGQPNINQGDPSQNENGQKKAKKDAACTRESRENKITSNNCKPGPQPDVINLPFPLHISELRSASEKQRESQQNATPELYGNYNSSIHLKQGEASQPKETPPSFSSLEASSSELVLSRLLSTISQEGIHAVGILATDVRDTLFLAREIHQHCPGTLVFTVASDVLYSHPDAISSTSGMLVFTPYPLYNLNQVWTPPYWGKKSRIQFRSQDAEGDYNATLALLCRKDLMRDYGEPFPPKNSSPGQPEAKPALWVTVVGRNGPLPVKTLRWKDCEKYSVRVTPGDFEGHKCELPESPSIDEDGICTSRSALGILLLTLILAGFSYLIIVRFGRPAKLEREDGSGWASRLFGEPVRPEYRRQVRLFLFASLVCVLCADIVLTAVYSVPALASCIRLENADWHWVIPVFQAAGLLFLAVAVAMVLRAYRKAPRNNSFLQLGAKLAVFGGCAIALLLSVRLAWVWVSAVWSSSKLGEAIFTYIRANDELSGLSPLVPLFCVALAGFLWAVCSFRRLRMIDGIGSASHEDKGDEYLLRMETQSFRGVEELENKVQGTLESASVLPTGWHAVVIVAPLLIIAATYLFFFPLVPSYEGWGFYFLFGWSFLLVFAALTMEFGRLCLTWAAFRHLLHRLALHPMREAFGRYRASFTGLHRIDLTMPLQTLSILSFSVDQAERLLRKAPSLVSSDEMSDAQRQSLKRWIPGAWLALWDANEHLSHALDADGKGKWRIVIDERSRAQSALGKLTQTTAELLEPSWRAAENTPSFPTECAKFKEFRELGEEFLAGRVVLLISYVLPALRKLGALILAGLVLMLLSVMFYPFVQKNHFLAFNWVVILGFVALALLVTLQMERDVVLSALNGTTPGQVKLTRQFTFRVLTYVMVPILLLLSAQFPDTLGQVVSWFTRFRGH